jgi:hypothetical protein
MSSPKFQKQHRISQVYLRQFGYLKENIWYISVWEKFKDYTDNKRIDEVTVETNIFDLPFEEEEIKRHFENTNSKIETLYPTIIKSLKNQKLLTPRHKDILCHYTANLFCRSKSTRTYFQNILNNSKNTNLFLQEITMFEPDILETFKLAFPLIPIEQRLNMAIGTIMNYLVTVLRSFNCIILEAIPDKGWFTSDNPVVINPQESSIDTSEYLYTIPIDSEIYLPLSPDYCLFFFHKNAIQNSNPLRTSPLNKIVKVDDIMHDSICKLILGNCDDYFIFNQQLDKTLIPKK